MADDDLSSGVNFFDFLPTEIITLVLTQQELCFKDVVNFGATCKRYRTITNDNELWKAKLIQRWPCLCGLANNIKPVPDWLRQCESLHHVPDRVRGLVRDLAAKSYSRDEVPYAHFQSLEELYLGGGLRQALTDDVLMGILSDRDVHKNLTQKYYARKALRHVRHVLLRQEWKDFFALPVPQQSLLEGAILFERWYKPCDPPPQDGIRQKVTEIANHARSKLKTDHPSCLDNTEGVVEMTPNQCYEVLDAVNDVLYKELEISGNIDDYYNESNSYISMVLTRKLGIPITLCILYEAVARKLGIVLRPVNFPDHFILRWNYSSDGFRDSDTNLFIDAFKKGNVMSSAEVLMGGGQMNIQVYSSEYLQPCVPKDVFRRTIANIMHLIHIQSRASSIVDGIELRAALNPEDFETVTGCVKYYIERRINYSLSLQMLSEVQPRSNMERTSISIFKDMINEAIDDDAPQDAEPPLPSPMRREDNNEVDYSVGMVMRHRSYHYSCVICGWDPVCALSTQWQRQMGIHQLPSREKQPFYNVLVEDSSTRYAAQENLEYIDAPVVVPHPEIGKYFQEFTQTCYQPNEQLARLYPDDTAITIQRARDLYAD